MGRPLGSVNREGTKKPGRKSGSTRLPQMKDDEILAAKAAILEILVSGEESTLSGAALKLGLKPINVYKWITNDKDFQELIRYAREVVADKLEKELSEHANFIPKMMILKGIRPMFRDNYKPLNEDSQALKIVETLLEFAKRSTAPVEAEENKT